MQGYLLSMPMTAEAYLMHLKNQPAGGDPRSPTANRNERRVGSLT
jgi:hypothetical protein